MVTTDFYERRRNIIEIGFENRRVVNRRNQEHAAAQEQRRLASQIRQHEREAFNIPLFLKLNCEDISSSTGNITPYGLRITTDTALIPGTPIAMHFSFGDNFCYMNISGQVVYCQSTNGANSIRYEIGIKFSAIRDFEKTVLASAVQEMKHNPAMQDESSLNIIISTDTLAQEATDLISGTSETLGTRRTGHLRQSPLFDQRLSPRLESNLSVRVFPDNSDAHIISLSETGFLLASEKPIHLRNLLLSIDSSMFKPDRFLELQQKSLGIEL